MTTKVRYTFHSFDGRCDRTWTVAYRWKWLAKLVAAFDNGCDGVLGTTRTQVV